MVVPAKDSKFLKGRIIYNTHKSAHKKYARVGGGGQGTKNKHFLTHLESSVGTIHCCYTPDRGGGGEIHAVGSDFRYLLKMGQVGNT